MADKKKRRRNRHDPNRAQTAAQREEARRRLREERRLAALAEAKKNRRMAVLKRWGRYAVIGGTVTLVALLVFRNAPEVEGVTKVAEIPAKELAPGATFDYGTATPTSGWYFENQQACGIFAEQITSEEAATAIYYGAVVLWYRPDIEAAYLASLMTLVTGYDSHVVVSPQASLEFPIVATAWNRRMGYDTPEGLEEFLDTYRKRAPGSGKGDCPIES